MEMQVVPFIKMHGLGNDYVYIDCFPQTTTSVLAQTDLAALARRMSDRHFGIGSDGLVLILPDTKADAYMRMFNADGSEAQMCGNAIRCVGKYLFESGLCHKPQMQIATRAGLRTIDLHVEGGNVEQVTVNMWIPKITQNIITIDKITRAFVSVNMGNPHAVFFCNSLPIENFAALGEQIGTHSLFPEGTNVEFVSVRNDKELDLRVWERGTGETLACGTGACAAAVAAIWLGKSQHNIMVHLRGGDLAVRWDSDYSPVFMTGPATEVFHGEYFIYH